MYISEIDLYKAFLFDYTNDTSDENIESKKRKYRREDMLFFIVGTRWYRRNTDDTIDTRDRNIRIIKHDLFAELIGLKGEHLFNYNHAIELSYDADLNGLKDFHISIK